MFLTNSENIKSVVRGFLYVFIALFPFVLYNNYLFDGTSTRSINTLVFIEISAIIVGVALMNKNKVLSFAKSPITVSMFLLLLTYVVSSIVGVDFSSSFWSKATRMTGLLYFSHVVFLYFLMWMTIDTKERVRNVLSVFSISTALFSVCTIFGMDGFQLIFKDIFWSGFTIGNSTFAGMYIYAGFMSALYLLYTIPKDKRRWWKYGILVPLIFSPYIVNFDIFRGTVDVLHNPLQGIGSAQASSVALFTSILFLVFAYGISKIKSSKKRTTVLFSSCIIGVLVLTFGITSLLSSGGKIQELYLKQSSAARPLVWEISKKAIHERPLFGWGLDNFDRAYQVHYTDKVLEKRNGGEAWFDRAHNIVIDTTIETGYVGLVMYFLLYATLFCSLMYVVVKSKDTNNSILALFLIVYFFGHLMELQTAFDTSTSYLLLVLFSVISGYLFHVTRYVEQGSNGTIQIHKLLKYGFALVLVVGYTVFFFKCTYPIIRAQNANGEIRKVGSSEKRILIYPTLFSSPVDRGAFLWGTSNDIQRGVYENKTIIEDEKQREGLKKELDIIVSSYEEYLKNEHPDDYRAILNLADIYIYQRLLDVDNLEKAHKVLDHAITLVPHSPQAYWMKSVAYLYQAKFDDAKKWSEKAYELNHDIEESERVREYITKSVKEFPVIDLYSFKQI